MRKVLYLLFPAMFACYSLFAQNTRRLLDQPMNLKSALIKINADVFTATTFIEMEFYNPNDVEIEGLYQFELKPGQVITAFQLELNGKCRDGSIEEKWKARNAYNTIVGKRVDPALLQMDWKDHYRLNVYPVPAKGSRKITMTIQQLMKPGDKQVDYTLPLNRQDTTMYLKVDVNVHYSREIPFAQKGLLETKTFVSSSDGYKLSWETENISLSKPLGFSIPLSNDHFRYCIKTSGQKNHFALYYKPQVALYSIIHPQKITVFWDASKSADQRNIGKEINFLQQYISWHKISQITIIPFNHKILDTAVFYTGNEFNSRWQQYLKNLTYDGATQLGMLDFSATTADAILLFSDGKNTYGKSFPKAGNALVYCITSSSFESADVLIKIAGSGGGSYIDLNRGSMNTAIDAASRSHNWLLNITSSSGKTIYEQQLPVKIDRSILISGVIDQADDTLSFYLGTNNKINKVEKFYLKNDATCSASGIDRIDMLLQAEAMMSSFYWEDILEFGLKEKIVTLNTSYLVLEKAEDYIKYNIAPPEDLKEKCEEMNYVWKDTRQWRNQLKEKSEFDILAAVVSTYNDKIKQWDKNAADIKLTTLDFIKLASGIGSNSSAANTTASTLTGSANGMSIGLSNQSNALEEVVVIGYGAQSKRNLTGSVSSVYSERFFPGTINIAQALEGRVAGVQVTSSGSPGNAGSIRIRGASSFSNNEPLYILDGMPVSGNVNDYISMNDIDNIQVLKDASATSLYGSRGGNGVIIINSKKGKSNYRYSYPRSPYKLKDMEDVEYLQEMKAEPLNNKLQLYEQLKFLYGKLPGFYFDIAQHFFETGMKAEALEVLMNAAEAGNGNYPILEAIGYILENWKNFDKAIEVYEQALSINPADIYAYRNLAWAYYQNQNYQRATDILYKAIKMNFEGMEWSYQPTKAMLLNEMNAIISLHKEKLDVSAIPGSIIKAMPADLRIVVDGNASFYNFTINEPGGTICSYSKPVSKKGGYLNKNANNYYYNNGIAEYQLKDAVEGKYKISVDHYDYSQDYTGYRIPSFLRISTFKNFGKENQSISIENVIMDNQSGTIEIAEIKW